MKYLLPIFFLISLSMSVTDITQAKTIVSPLPDEIISPLAEVQPFPEVTKSPETDETHEWSVVARAIIDEFENEGKDTTEWALRCFYSESGWRSEAYNFNSNGTEDKGVAQINSVHKFTGDLHDIEYNLQKAHEIFKRQGKKAWYGKLCN